MMSESNYSLCNLWWNVCVSGWLILYVITCLVSWCHALSQSWLWMADPSSFGFDDIMPCLMMFLDVMSYDVMFHEVSWCHVSQGFIMSCFSPISPLFLFLVILFHCLWRYPIHDSDWLIPRIMYDNSFYLLLTGNYFRL